MAEISIDICEDQIDPSEITAVNAALLFITVQIGPFEVQMHWDHAEKLYSELRQFFEEESGQ
jgi:hypothetical protein